MAAMERYPGTVVRILGDYGFIQSDVVPGQDVYFRLEWCSDPEPLSPGEAITFELRSFDGKPQARSLTRATMQSPAGIVGPSAGQVQARPTGRQPTSGYLLEWAYLGYVPAVLAGLAELALEEQWEFKAEAGDPNRPLPILYSYVMHTFGRLCREGKIAINNEGTYAGFNTGLVDRRYEPIYALFARNNGPRLYWKLDGFCISAEHATGQNLVRNFNPLPRPAHYFDDPSELLYDAREGEPEVNWKHIVIDNMDRFPAEFVEDIRPPDFSLRDTRGMSDSERETYFSALRETVRANDRIYRMFISRLRDALKLSIKRVSWNFKTAIPHYYTRVARLNLLLPLCLVTDDRVDLALAVERTPAGSYLGHTILPLDWAYKYARLICRPDSDWLNPRDIMEGPLASEETANSSTDASVGEPSSAPADTEDMIDRATGTGG
jgi:hypothetical protein